MLDPPTIHFDPNCTDGITVDLQGLLTHKLTIQGASRSGKSWLVRTLLEGTHGHVQHLIIDPEGEFRTLREIFDDYLILAAADGDIAITAETAGTIIRQLVPQGVNIILDLSEFGRRKRDEICAAVVNTLMALPRAEWRHLMTVVDEAHTLAAQEGGRSPSLEALTDLATRGGKRGFGMVVVTQRIALLDKSLLAMCSNHLVGLTTLGNDMRRASEVLGFNTRERLQLKNLEIGQFFAFGPAISREIVKVRSGPVRSRHPEPGEIIPPAPAASDTLRLLIEELRAAEPEEAEESAEATEERTRVVYRGVTEEEAEQRTRRAVDAATAPLRGRIEWLEQLVRGFVTEASDALSAELPPAEPAPPAPRLERPARRQTAEPVQTDGFTLERPQARILKALAEIEVLGVTSLNRRTAAVLSNQSPKSSAYGRHISTLQSQGLISYPSNGEVALTAAGRELAPDPDRPATVQELHARWLNYLNAYEADLLRVAIEHYPHEISRDDLGNLSGRSINSSAFGNALAGLRNLGLLDYPSTGYVRATSLLFPPGLEGDAR